MNKWSVHTLLEGQSWVISTAWDPARPALGIYLENAYLRSLNSMYENFIALPINGTKSHQQVYSHNEILQEATERKERLLTSCASHIIMPEKASKTWTHLA